MKKGKEENKKSITKCRSSTLKRLLFTLVLIYVVGPLRVILTVSDDRPPPSQLLKEDFANPKDDFLPRSPSLDISISKALLKIKPQFSSSTLATSFEPLWKPNDRDNDDDDDDDANNSSNKGKEISAIPVVVWPLIEFGTHNVDCFHFMVDGIQQSSWLELATTDMLLGRVSNNTQKKKNTTTNESVVWIVDMSSRPFYSCNKLVNRLQQSMTFRREQGYSTVWPIVFVDLSEKPKWERCAKAEKLMKDEQERINSHHYYYEDEIFRSPNLVSYFSRTVSVGRKWMEEQQWVDPGRLVTLEQEIGGTIHTRYRNKSENITGDFQYRHISIVVRTDIVERLDQILKQDRYNHLELFDSIEEQLSRPVDVWHAWPLNNSHTMMTAANTTRREARTRNNGTTQIINHRNGQLRSHVSELLHRYSVESGWNAVIGLQGAAMQRGRRTVSDDYIHAMLSTKIIIVTQRDEHEDHYRLMEALVSGACVFSDFMLGLPKGLKNGSSIVLFSSAQELESLLSYYLQHNQERVRISREGRRIAMSQHRSWHWLERMVFGKIKTTCNTKNTIKQHPPNKKSVAINGHCPYLVHIVNASNRHSTSRLPMHMTTILEPSKKTRVEVNGHKNKTGQQNNKQQQRRPQIEIPEPALPPSFSTLNDFAKFIETLHNSTQAVSASSFRPRHFHYIRDHDSPRHDQIIPVPVLFWPLVVSGVQTTEHKHLGYNGIAESPYLDFQYNLSNFENPDLVWVVDMSYQFTCNKLRELILGTIAERYTMGYATQWPIFLIHFGDNRPAGRCKTVENLIGSDFLSYAIRAVTDNRNWSRDKSWVDVGRYVGNETFRGVPFRHIPLFVRTDIVEELQNVLQTNHQMELHDSIEDLSRPIDVMHVWPLNYTVEIRKIINDRLGEFRNHISQLLFQYGQELGWKTSIGLKGEGVVNGRRGVKSVYIEGMLETKIMVVTQRDRWEDHYRLMEALVSGACVFSDFMYGLPQGLINGTSIILFTSAQDLKSLLTYYLEHDYERISIGREGRRVAMSRHRSFHRMEEIVFGRVKSTCTNLEMTENKNKDHHCPYMVHTPVWDRDHHHLERNQPNSAR